MKSLSVKCLKTPIACAIACAISSASIAVEQPKNIETNAKITAIEQRLEVIEVRSSKKSYAESAQDVPITMTVLSGDQIEAMGADNIVDVAYSAPNVNLAPIGTVTGVANYSIRGMGVVNSIPSVDPAVGVVVDGVALGTIYGALTSTFDVQSVEILRGPQGTLFGRNVTGGVVNIRSERPTEKFDAKFQATIGSHEQKDFALSFGGNIQGTLDGKVAILTTEHGGNIDNLTVGRKQGAGDSTLIRPMLKYSADNFDVTLIVESFESSNEDVPVFGTKVFEGDIKHKTKNFNIMDGTQKWTSLVLETNIDLFDGALTMIYGHRDLDVDSWAEVGSGLIEFKFGNLLEQTQDSLEIRWSGELNENITLTTGAFFFDQFYDYDEERYIAGSTHYIRGGEMDHSSQAVFAQVDYIMSDDLTLTLGGRYGTEEKEAKVFVANTGACDAVDYATPGDHSSCDAPKENNDWNNFSPKVGFRYQLNDNDIVYASWSKGFRSGGYNFRHSDPESTAEYDDESLSAFELGYKAMLLNGQLLFNAAIFNNTVNNMQATSNRPLPNGDIIAVVANEAKVNLTGIELSAFLAITDNIGVDFSYGYTDHDYDKWPAEEKNINNGAGQVDDLSDLVLPMAPKSQGYIGLVATQEMDFGLLTFNGSYSYNGETFGDQPNANPIDAYGLVNVSLKLDLNSTDMSIKAFVRNAANQAYSAFAYSLGHMIAPPRSYGVQVNYTF